MAKKQAEQYSDEEVEQRALAMVRRSFTLPHKTATDYKGKTPRARAMARTRKRNSTNPKAS